MGGNVINSIWPVEIQNDVSLFKNVVFTLHHWIYMDGL